MCRMPERTLHAYSGRRRQKRTGYSTAGSRSQLPKRRPMHRVVTLALVAVLAKRAPSSGSDLEVCGTASAGVLWLVCCIISLWRRGGACCELITRQRRQPSCLAASRLQQRVSRAQKVSGVPFEPCRWWVRRGGGSERTAAACSVPKADHRVDSHSRPTGHVPRHARLFLRCATTWQPQSS
jgi:hypothetical protein